MAKTVWGLFICNLIVPAGKHRFARGTVAILALCATVVGLMQFYDYPFFGLVAISLLSLFFAVTIGVAAGKTQANLADRETESVFLARFNEELRKFDEALESCDRHRTWGFATDSDNRTINHGRAVKASAEELRLSPRGLGAETSILIAARTAAATVGNRAVFHRAS